MSLSDSDNETVHPMVAPGDRVYVLGAGLVGLSVALWLQSFGVQVTIVDKSEPGSGASYGNAGLFANYAVVPHMSRAVLRSLPGLLADRDRAVSVRPHYWGAMWHYGREVLRQVRPDAFATNRENLVALVRQADKDFLSTLALGGATDQVRSQGCLWVFRSEHAWQVAHDRERPSRTTRGVACETVSKSEIAGLEPALRSAGLYGGLFFPDTRHLISPSEVSRRLHDTLVRRGGQFIRDEVADVQRDANGRSRVVCANGIHEASHVVIALGVHSRDLFRRMGYRLPLISERGYHVSLSAESACLTRPVGWPEHFFYATPMNDGIRLAGTTEFGRPDASPNPKRWAQLGRWAQTLFGEQVEVRSKWCGSRASTPDGLPIVGPLSAHSGVYACTGHGHLGVTLAGVTGRHIAERLTGRNVRGSHKYLLPERFLS